MSAANFAPMLRSLARDYFEQRLSMQDYRAQRKAILDEMDSVFNGAIIQADGSDTALSPVGSMDTVVFSIDDDAKTDRGDATTQPGLFGNN
jgi:hypothetical protein